jgi:hypothetical protein
MQISLRSKFLIAFMILGFSSSVYAAGLTAAPPTPSYPHPAGSTFTPVTVTPTLPPVNSATAQSKENAVSNENSAAESAVTQTQSQVNQTINNQQTQQDLNAQTGMDTTSSQSKNTK